MKANPILWLATFAMVTLPACTFLHAPPKPASEATKPAPIAPQMIGRIAAVPADKRFVLIQNFGNGKINAGTILTTRGPDDRTANLLTTGESLGQFTAADVQSGLLEVGDGVYSRHIPAPTVDSTDNPPPAPPDSNLKK